MRSQDQNYGRANGHSKPKVLVPEKVSADGLAQLRKTLQVDERKGLTPDQLLEMIAEYDALIVRSETKVTAPLLQAGKRLKVVARAGVGVDNVDVPAATKLGVIVVNSPSGNIGAAAEHTIALMLALARNIPDACSSLKAGKWERSRLVGVEMKGKTLGIIGLGKVGLNVARCAIGLGMTVEALDPYASPAIAQAAHVSMVSSLGELLQISDFLTIHTPLIASTKGMIGKNELSTMKKGARILNVARGGMIDELALLESLESGHLAGAGMDVFSTEPPATESPAARLIGHPKVVCTPHLGASTVEAQENVSLDVCSQVLAILAGDLPRSAVNAPLIMSEEYKTLQPFVRLVEKMGSLYTQHFQRLPSSQQQQQQQHEPRTTFDLVYAGKLAELSNTRPLFAALVKGLTSQILDTPVNIVNAELIAADRGLAINERHERSFSPTYASLVTLRARPAAQSRASSRRPAVSRAQPQAPSATTSGAAMPDHGTAPAPAAAARPREQVICGYVSASQIYISRIDRFATSFVPEGNLLICHNFDSPGKIGVVGGILGREGVNINFMSVAPVSRMDDDDDDDDEGVSGDVDEVRAEQQDAGGGIHGFAKDGGSEALMILGVNREVGRELVGKIGTEQGILEISSVTL